MFYPNEIFQHILSFADVESCYRWKLLTLVKQKIETLTLNQKSDLIRDIVYNENIDLLKYINDAEMNDTGALCGVFYGHLNFLQLMHINNILVFNSNHLSLAAKEGHLHIIKFYITISNWKNFINYQRLFDEAAEYGHLDVVQFLLEKYMCRTHYAEQLARKNMHMAVYTYLAWSGLPLR